MDKQIEKILNNFYNLQDLIKYAESKNTILIGFVLAIIAFTKKYLAFCNLMDCFSSIGNIFLIISGIISLLSMMPKTKQIYSIKRKEISDPNLFLFSDISSIPEKNRFVQLFKKEYLSNRKTEKEADDIIDQIYTLSIIAFQKFTAFNIAIIFFTVGILLHFLTILI